MCTGSEGMLARQVNNVLSATGSYGSIGLRSDGNTAFPSALSQRLGFCIDWTGPVTGLALVKITAGSAMYDI